MKHAIYIEDEIIQSSNEIGFIVKIFGRIILAIAILIALGVKL